MKPESIKIDDTKYIREDLVGGKAEDLDGMPCMIVRTYSAGVFYGYIEKQEGQEVTIRHARRMWQWFGASLSELAQSGTPDQSKCKFPEPVYRIKVLQAIEMLDLTHTAKKSLDGVKIWKA